MEKSVKYYHGGPRGLREILPPNITGAPSCASYGASRVCNMDKVYLTTLYEGALLYAAMQPSGNGVVYEVEPVGRLMPDQDYCGNDGESVEADRATVVRRFKVPGKLIKKIQREIMRGH